MNMNVKIIKSPEDYEAAMARLSALMSLDPKANSKEEDELELLALVIQDFERQTVPSCRHWRYLSERGGALGILDSDRSRL